MGVGAAAVIILPSENLATGGNEKREENRRQREATADTNYWPVYRFCLRNYPLVRLANCPAANAPLNGGA